MLRTIIYVVLVLLIAVFSVAASEVLLAGVWLPNAPISVTDNLFWLGLLPVQLIVVGVASLALLKIHRANRLYMALYALVFSTAHATELHMFNNPPADIGLYVLAICSASAIWFMVLRQFFPGAAKA